LFHGFGPVKLRTARDVGGHAGGGARAASGRADAAVCVPDFGARRFAVARRPDLEDEQRDGDAEPVADEIAAR
jgi:hypothetical protein